jgi:anti-anti-sigma regulatory factor
LRSGGGVLKFCCVSEKISNLFKIMHLTTVFEIHEDQPTALAELGVVEA